VTDDERKQEGAEEPIEDLEAPAAEQRDVAGGVGVPCAPTNACHPVHTVVKGCLYPTQICGRPTCQATVVFEQ
jgi:hypothetical protein